MKESDMNGPVIKYFTMKGYVEFEQVAAGFKKIDLYFIHRNYPKTIAIELKINKWKKALVQAIQNLNYAQKSYVGIWNEHLDENKIEIFSKYGIGVIKIYDDDIEIMSKPSNNYYGLTSPVKRIIDNQIENNKIYFLWDD